MLNRKEKQEEKIREIHKKVNYACQAKCALAHSANMYASKEVLVMDMEIAHRYILPLLEKDLVH